jgi:hypothetical protein
MPLRVRDEAVQVRVECVGGALRWRSWVWASVAHSAGLSWSVVKPVAAGDFARRIGTVQSVAVFMPRRRRRVDAGTHGTETVILGANEDDVAFLALHAARLFG